jgi:hypothetical protein
VTVATAVLSLGIFVVALRLSGIVGVSAGVLSTTRDTLAIIRDTTLDDAARERAVQRASVSLMARFASILGRGALALAASLVPVWVADTTGVASFSAVLDLLTRWDVMLIGAVVMVAVFVIPGRSWRSS